MKSSKPIFPENVAYEIKKHINTVIFGEVGIESTTRPRNIMEVEKQFHLSKAIDDPVAEGKKKKSGTKTGTRMFLSPAAGISALPILPELMIFKYFWSITLFNHSLERLIPVLDYHLLSSTRQKPHLDYFDLLDDTKNGIHSSPFIDLPFSIMIAIDEGITLDIYSKLNEKHLSGQAIRDIETIAVDCKEPTVVDVEPSHMLLFAGCVCSYVIQIVNN